MQAPTCDFLRPRTLCGWIFALAALHVVVGVGLWVWWRMGGPFDPLEVYFAGPGVMALLGFALMEVALAAYAWGSFTWDQPMWVAWGCLTLAGAVRLAGVVIAHVLTATTWLNPLPEWAGREPLHEIGLMLTGPGHVLFVLLAMGIALRVYRAEGWRARLQWVDWTALGIVGVYLLRQFYELAFVYREAMLREPWKLVNWVTDPVIFTALTLALLLYRTSGGFTEGGLIGRCWAMYAAGLFLSSFGDMGFWAIYSGRLTWENASLVTWYIWYPAAAAYAAGPALQVEALFAVRRSWIAGGATSDPGSSASRP